MGHFSSVRTVYSPALPPNTSTMMERPARDKHSSLLGTFVNYAKKVFWPHAGKLPRRDALAYFGSLPVTTKKSFIRLPPGCC